MLQPMCPLRLWNESAASDTRRNPDLWWAAASAIGLAGAAIRRLQGHETDYLDLTAFPHLTTQQLVAGLRRARIGMPGLADRSSDPATLCTSHEPRAPAPIGEGQAKHENDGGDVRPHAKVAILHVIDVGH